LIQQLGLLTQQQQALQAEEADPVGTRVLKFLRARVTEAGDEFGALEQALCRVACGGALVHPATGQPDDAPSLGELDYRWPRSWSAARVRSHWAIWPSGGHADRSSGSAKGSTPRRFMLGIVRLILRLIPVALFGFAGYSLLSLIDPPALVSLATLTIINAAILVMAVIAASRFCWRRASRPCA